MCLLGAGGDEYMLSKMRLINFIESISLVHVGIYMTNIGSLLQIQM